MSSSRKNTYWFEPEHIFFAGLIASEKITTKFKNKKSSKIQKPNQKTSETSSDNNTAYGQKIQHPVFRRSASNKKSGKDYGLDTHKYFEIFNTIQKQNLELRTWNTKESTACGVIDDLVCPVQA